MDAEYFGKVTRHLIANQSKGRPVPREELRDLLEVSSKVADGIIERLPGFLQTMGIELVGLSQNDVVAVEEARKFFLRKIPVPGTKRMKMMPTVDECRFFLVLSAVQLENNRLDEAKFETIKVSPWFKSAQVNELFAKYKAKGYLVSKRENETTIWSLGWRFYVEFADCLDIVEYFNELPDKCLFRLNDDDLEVNL